MLHSTILRCSNIGKLREVNVMSIVAIVFLVGVALFLTLQAGAEG
jgi:hypothetical protein